MVELLIDRDAVDQITAAEITKLTRRATEATYHAEGLNADEVGFIERSSGFRQTALSMQHAAPTSISLQL